jgi:hypothetical protein
MVEKKHNFKILKKNHFLKKKVIFVNVETDTRLWYIAKGEGGVKKDKNQHFLSALSAELLFVGPQRLGRM